MSQPTLKNLGTKYIFEWEDEKLIIEVSKIHTHTDGRTTCNLLTTTTNASYKPHILQTMFNLSSSRSRTELKKELAKRYKEKVDWDEILESLCYNTLDVTSKGEPAMELYTHEDVEPPKYLLKPIMPLHQPTILFGDGGIGKSEIAILLDICMLLPWHDNTLGLVTPAHSVKAIYLDWETEQGEFLWKAKCIQEGIGVPPFSLLYRKCGRPLYDDIEGIQADMEKHNAEALIIDSLGYAAGAGGGELKESSTAIKFFTALRQLNTSSLIIAHTSKDREVKTKTVFGSAYFTFASRSIWEVKNTQTEGEDELSIAMFHRKANLSKLHLPVGFKFKFNEYKTAVEYVDVRSVATFLENMKTTTRILEELKGGAMTLDDIAKTLDISLNNASTSITRLKQKEKVVKINKDHWGLPTEQGDDLL